MKYPIKSVNDLLKKTPLVSMQENGMIIFGYSNRSLGEQVQYKACTCHHCCASSGLFHYTGKVYDSVESLKEGKINLPFYIREITTLSDGF